jgi:hypothetical protein
MPQATPATATPQERLQNAKVLAYFAYGQAFLFPYLFAFIFHLAQICTFSFNPFSFTCSETIYTYILPFIMVWTYGNSWVIYYLITKIEKEARAELGQSIPDKSNPIIRRK